MGLLLVFLSRTAGSDAEEQKLIVGSRQFRVLLAMSGCGSNPLKSVKMEMAQKFTWRREVKEFAVDGSKRFLL